MEQSSATQSLHLGFWGLRTIVAYSHYSSQCLLISTVFDTVSSLHPTYFYTCNYNCNQVLLHGYYVPKSVGFHIMRAGGARSRRRYLSGQMT